MVRRRLTRLPWEGAQHVQQREDNKWDVALRRRVSCHISEAFAQSSTSLQQVVLPVMLQQLRTGPNEGPTFHSQL